MVKGGCSICGLLMFILFQRYCQGNSDERSLCFFGDAQIVRKRTWPRCTHRNKCSTHGSKGRKTPLMITRFIWCLLCQTEPADDILEGPAGEVAEEGERRLPQYGQYSTLSEMRAPHWQIITVRSFSGVFYDYHRRSMHTCQGVEWDSTSPQKRLKGASPNAILKVSRSTLVKFV